MIKGAKNSIRDKYEQVFGEKKKSKKNPGASHIYLANVIKLLHLHSQNGK